MAQESVDKTRPENQNHNGARHKPSFANIAGSLKVTDDMRSLSSPEYLKRVVEENNIKSNPTKKPATKPVGPKC